MPGGINEYVIKLSTQIDNPGVSQILSLLDSTKLKAAAVTSVFATATAAIYKFISSAAQKEIELRSLANQQHKNIENLRQQQTALNSMGKTLQQINKDKDLKEIYKDVLEFNKSFETMDISGAIKKINGLRTAFYKLKSAIAYTIQEIGKRVLVNLEEPIDRITGKLTTFANWIRDNFVSLTSKIASFVTAFAKGILTILSVVEKIAKFFTSIPESLRGIIGAMTAIVAILKSGPIGMLLAAVELIGSIKDDYNNYQWNKQNADPNNKKPVYMGPDGKPTFTKPSADAEPYQIPIALEPIWEIKDDESLDKTEKARKMGEKVVGYFTGMIEGISADELGTQFGGMINNIFTKLTSALSGDASGIMGQAFEAIKLAIQKLFEFLATAIQTINFSDVLDSINLIIGKVMSLLTEALNTGLDVVFGSHGQESQEAEKGALDYAMDFIKSIIEAIGKASESIKLSDVTDGIGNFVNNLFTKIGEWLGSSTNTATQIPGDLLVSISKFASGVLDAIISGLNALLKKDENGKTGIETFVTGLFEFLKNSITDLATKISGGSDGFDLSSALSGIGEKIGSIIGDVIVIGTDFLFTFVDEAIKWITDNVDKFVDIGRRILGAILQGIGNIWDAIMKKLFGDNWVGTGERRETVDTVAGQFVDEEGNPVDTITDIYGNESTRDEALDYASTDTRAAQVRYGLSEATDFEAYKRGFYGQLGANGLSMGLGSSDNFVGDIAKLFGINYDPSSMTLSGENGSIDSSKSAELLGMITDLNFADSIETFKSTFEQINSTLTELGLGGVDTGDADSAGQAAAIEAQKKLAESAESASSDVDSLGGKSKTTAGFFSDLGAAARAAGIELRKVKANKTEEAYGGRIGQELNNVTVGEDGPEYIIPITKPERAITLINQMLNEMGSSAVSKVLKGFGFGQSGTIGANMASISSAMSGLVMNNTFNISAPVNINISSSEASAEAIGTQAYNLAERHLIKTLRGVYA